MNRKSKYIILSAALVTVLAAIVVSLGGRLAPGEEAEETPSPESAAYVTEGTKSEPPTPPSAPESVSAPAAPPSAPEPAESGEPLNDIHAVAVTAGPGGTVEPRGLVSVRDGESVSFSFTPDAGYEVAEVKVDGRTVASPAGYLFSNVHDSHTLYVVFRAAETEPEETDPPEETPEPTDEPEASPKPGDGGEVISGFLG